MTEMVTEQRDEGRAQSRKAEYDKVDGIGNIGTDDSKIGSLLGTVDRYFHGNSPFFRGPVFIFVLSSLILPLQPYWFLLACPHPFSGHHIDALAPLSSPSPVPHGPQGLSPLALPEMQRWWKSASPQESPQTSGLRNITYLFTEIY